MMRIVGLLLAVAAPVLAQTATDARRHVAILKDQLAGTDAATADAVAATMRREGFEVTFLSAKAACEPAALSRKKHFLYIVDCGQIAT